MGMGYERESVKRGMKQEGVTELIQLMEKVREHYEIPPPVLKKQTSKPVLILTVLYNRIRVLLYSM